MNPPFGKELDVLEMAGYPVCFSAFYICCGLGILLIPGDSIPWALYSRTPTKEACCPVIGKRMIVNGPAPIVEEVWGLLCRLWNTASLIWLMVSSHSSAEI